LKPVPFTETEAYQHAKDEYYYRPLVAGEHLFTYVAHVPPGGVMPPDAEEAKLFELSLLMLEGMLVGTLGDDTVVLSTGDALHIPRGVAFGVSNETDRTAGFVLSFSPPPRVDLASVKSDAIAKGRVVLEPDEMAERLGPLQFPPRESWEGSPGVRLLVMASYGLEIVECGGAVAKALEAGADVTAAVLLAQEPSREQIADAARRLGITNEVLFLDGTAGEVTIEPSAKIPVVELIRRVKPDVVIMQDPEHAQHDLDPDRRLIALLYAESLAVAGRDWRIDECGGHPPCTIPTIYYMTPQSPNCIIEISSVIRRKVAALDALKSQMEFSSEIISKSIDSTLLEYLVPDAEIRSDPLRLGLEMHSQFERANALHHGLAGHSGAVIGEAYRREGPFVLQHLIE